MQLPSHKRKTNTRRHASRDPSHLVHPPFVCRPISAQSSGNKLARWGKPWRAFEDRLGDRFSDHLLVT